jgi:hypothetical protein
LAHSHLQKFALPTRERDGLGGNRPMPVSLAAIDAKLGID